MPSQGRAVERVYTGGERAALGNALPALGDPTFDVCLNGEAIRRNVPAPVWTFCLDGYHVHKKWYSYGEGLILGPPPKLEEVRHFSDIERRIQEIIQSIPQDSST